MNIFQCSYEQRLRSWKQLRVEAKSLLLIEQCLNIDRWWQYAPLVSRHLHPTDMYNWPDPWTLLSENTYCLLTRALGILYTLEMCGIKNNKLVMATDNQGEDCPLVLVDGAKYVLNYWPNMVLNIKSADFTVKKTFDLELIKHKIT